MADTVPITAGSGTSIATDDISSVHYQRIKLIYGADGVNSGDVSTANPFPVTIPPNNASGSITTQNLVPGGTATAGSAVELTCDDSSSSSIQVTGTYTGALSVQATVDGAAWITFGGSPLINVNTGASQATIASASVGIWQLDCSAFLKVRVTALAAVTGTAVVTLIGSAGTGAVAIDTALPTGANIIGALVANQSINNAQVNGVTVSVDNGATGTGVQRVTLANNGTGVVGLIAGTADVGSVIARQGRFTFEVDVPGVANTAHAAADQLGTIITITNAARVSGGTGTIESITYYDNDDVVGALDFHFFDSTVTLAADDAVYAVSDADNRKKIATQNMTYVIDEGAQRYGQLVGIDAPYTLNGGTSLFLGIQLRAAATFTGGATGQHVRIVMIRD